MPRRRRGMLITAIPPPRRSPFSRCKKDEMTRFSEIGINDDILKALDALGFDTPTPVQEQIIPALLEQRTDLVGLAQTGTGKTAAFAIPLIQQADAGLRQTQALVLCPTRELCVQVARDITALAKYVKGLKVLAVYGGASIEHQIKSLRRGIQIVVATPGRLHDLIRRGKVDISAVGTVVLDEADEMMQMGFQDELNAILDATPGDRNTLLFSATMPAGVAAIAAKYMRDPREITVGRRNAGAKNVRHVYYVVQAKDRYQALRRLADSTPEMYGIVFCRTRDETRQVAQSLANDGYSADAIHGELTQGQRDLVMNRFRRRQLRMLVATDVAARGLDVNDLTHVINYNLPDDFSSYTHRSGRTGRAGKDGTSVVIVHSRERHKIRAIEGLLKRKFEKGLIPTGRDICEKKILDLTDRLTDDGTDHSHIAPFLPSVVETLASLDREELIKRFLSLQSNGSIGHYLKAPDLNVGEEKRAPATRNRKNGPPARSSSHLKFTSFTLNVGKRDGVDPTRLIGEINEGTGSSRIRIGKIKIKNNSSLLEADSRYAPQILGAFRRRMINGKPVYIEQVAGKGKKQAFPAAARP
jgi:ATP-dependent RNA helicase DeaD